LEYRSVSQLADEAVRGETKLKCGPELPDDAARPELAPANAG